jgi:hypothetical protein
MNAWKLPGREPELRTNRSKALLQRQKSGAAKESSLRPVSAAMATLAVQATGHAAGTGGLLKR